MEKFTYAALLVGSLAVPLLRSFEPKIQFHTKFKALFTATFITAFVFIVWDIIFTANGIWSFNHHYVIGLFVGGLPIEEWLFFVVIPYACIFIYEVLRYFVKINNSATFWQILNRVVFLSLLIIGAYHADKTYTFVVTIFTAVVYIFTFVWKRAQFYGHFYLGFLVSLIPFFLVNYVLTSIPVVSYDNTENMSVRLTTIPIEDSIYLLGLLLINTLIYEWILRKQKTNN